MPSARSRTSRAVLAVKSSREMSWIAADGRSKRTVRVIVPPHARKTSIRKAVSGSMNCNMVLPGGSNGWICRNRKSFAKVSGIPIEGVDNEVEVIQSADCGLASKTDAVNLKGAPPVSAQRLTSCRASFRRERNSRSWSATDRNCWIIEQPMFKLKGAFLRGAQPAEPPQCPNTQLLSIPFRGESIHLTD
jgi:hypothetical protein